ncbi:MAG: tail fiber domain-containing protein [Verrucomicrobiota bacterium]
MKTKLQTLLVLLAALAGIHKAAAQGTAFTYQGQLNVGAAPADGSYDFVFALYDNAQNGNQIGPAVTNSAVGVTNGLFTTTIDFGSGLFTGSNYWLNLSVRSNSTGPFTDLAPRQPVTPAPYAVFANTASNLSGTLLASQLSGPVPLAQLPAAVLTNNQDGATLNGTFSGDGSGLTNLNTVSFSSTMALGPLNWNVSFWGDSLSDGGGTGGPYGNLCTSFIPQIVPTINGYSGQNSAYILSQFRAASSQWPNVQVIWSGNNDVNSTYTLAAAEAVTNNIWQMITNLPAPTNYIIIGIDCNQSNSNGTPNQAGILLMNTWLSNTYSPRYLDVYHMLLSHPSTSQDLLDVAGGVVPTSLRYDAVHLNLAGYTLVASNVCWILSNTVYAQPVRMSSLPALASAPPLATNLSSLTVSPGPAKIYCPKNLPWGSNSISLYDTTPWAQGVGASIGFLGYVDGVPDYTTLATIEAQKENSTSGDGTGDLVFNVRKNPNSVSSEVMRLRGSDSNAVFQGGVSAVSFTANGVLLTSDRNAKENFAPLDGQKVLAKVAALPLTKWNYKTDGKEVQHIGPMAQDFQAEFQLNGGDDQHISVVDEGGVALAAIQGLNQKLNVKDAEIQALKQSVEELKEMVQTLAGKK